MKEDRSSFGTAWGALIVMLVVGVWASMEPKGRSVDPWTSSGDPVREEVGGFAVDADFVWLFARQLGREVLPTSFPRLEKALSPSGHGPSTTGTAAVSSPRAGETGVQDLARAGIP